MLFLMISFDSGMGTHPNNTLTCSGSYKRTLYAESHFLSISLDSVYAFLQHVLAENNCKKSVSNKEARKLNYLLQN